MRPSITIAALIFAISTSVQAEDLNQNASQISVVSENFTDSPHRQLIHKTQLNYPRSAILQGREVSILLRYTIEADGHVDDIEVVRGRGAAFIEEAKKAVTGWIYTPAAEPTPGATALALFHAAP